MDAGYAIHRQVPCKRVRAWLTPRSMGVREVGVEGFI
jgi:hypothetical protein